MSTDAYVLRLDRSLDREVARLIRTQTNRARRELKTPTDGAVHAARKALKRARAVLRLVRGVLPRDRYRSLDRDLRGLGRRLAPARDAAVALGLVDTLQQKGALDRSAGAVLRDHLQTVRAEAWQALDADTVATIRAELHALRLAPEELPNLDASAFHDGLARTYARGHERFAQAVEHPSAETLHAWRRQVKYLGYQLRLLAPAWPLVVRPAARALDALGKALGDEHDLSELVRVAERADLDRAALREVTREVLQRRETIQEGVWPLGARIYAESDEAFAGRMIAYLAAGLAEAHDAPILPLRRTPAAASPERPLDRVPASV